MKSGRTLRFARLDAASRVTRQGVMLLLLAVLATAASATHLPHLPEMIQGVDLGMHARAEQVQSGVAIGPRIAQMAADEIWCSVQALPPARLMTVLLLLVVAAFLLRAQPTSHPRPQVEWRTKPPPLVGSRLRAALQVYRN